MSKDIFRTLAHASVILFGVSSAPLLRAALAAPTTETLVMVRHGEKPADVDNGQLTCQGENRALALPAVLLGKYGTPQYLFAGATVSNQDDQGNTYYYLRALATIEPTAIQAGLTVNIKYANDDISDLQSELAKSQYQNALVFLAWEHNDLDELAANIVKKNGGDPSIVPAWDDDDFDSIFVITITQTGSSTAVTFTHDYEELNSQSTFCGQLTRRYLLPIFPIRP